MSNLCRLKSRQLSDSANNADDADVDASAANQKLEAAFESMSSLIFSADEKDLHDVYIITSNDTP